MTWPSSDVPTTALDAGTDTPPRSVFMAWAQAFNQMRAHVTTFMQGVLGSADAAAARTALDVPSRSGGNASGTWGISISGNASTATDATNCGRSVAGAGLASGGGPLTSDQTITVTEATTVDAQSGTGTGVMTARRTAEAIAAQAVPLGHGQTYQAVTRVSGTDYQNALTRTITLVVTFNGRGGQVRVGVSTASYTQVSGNTSSISDDSNSRPVHTIPVPPGHYYRINGTINNVKELR